MFSPSRSLLAGLLIFIAGSLALAQPGADEAEFEFGGGYHYGFDLGSDWYGVPSTPTVDVRITRWTSDRWGMSVRGLVGLGGVLRGHAGAERRHPTYAQVLIRYRRGSRDGLGLHLGIGGGMWGAVDEDGFAFSFHILAVEALASKRLTERLSIRGGVSTVVPLHVHPTLLLAWGF